MQAKFCEGRQRSCFVEKVQVANRELLGDCLTNLNGRPLITHTVSSSNFNAAGAGVRLNTEKNEISVGRYGQCFAERKKFPADFLEFTRVHTDCRAVLCLRDCQVLSVQTD